MRQLPTVQDGENDVLPRRKLQELVAQISPTDRLEPDVEEILMEIADDFIESVTTFACNLAKHRKSNMLEVKDIQLHLERNWNIKVPGFSGDDTKPYKRPTIPDPHKQRLNLVRKAQAQAAHAQAQAQAAATAAAAPAPTAPAPAAPAPTPAPAANGPPTPAPPVVVAAPPTDTTAPPKK